MTRKVAGKDHPALRKISRELDRAEIGGAKIRRLIRGMQRILAEQDDGVALAAPQVGENLRIFVVSPRIFGENLTENEHLVYINPKIIKRSAKKLEVEEGCLSVPGVYGLIERAEKATVEALDEQGRRFVRGGSGIMAELFQHEIDHLDGKLFVDRARNLHEITREDKN